MNCSFRTIQAKPLELSYHNAGLTGKSYSRTVTKLDETNRLSGNTESTTPEMSVTQSIFSRIVSVVKNTVTWLCENRLGLAKLFGFLLVPSQHDITCNSKACSMAMDYLCDMTFEDGRSYERVKIKHKGIELDAVVCYPPGWNPESDDDGCIVYNNANAMLINDMFDRNKIGEDNVPGVLQAIRPRPVILYDYRGTGLNKTVQSPWPTAKTIVQDGTAVLQFAAEKFGKVAVTGTSLGGAVGTVSLENVLNNNSAFSPDQFCLVNHASFNNTPRVVLPFCPKIADVVGNILGVNINAGEAIKKLNDRKVSMLIMNNNKDPVIPRGARMTEEVKRIPSTPTVKIVEDEVPDAHVELTRKFAEPLWNGNY